jgi:hypothetical protein
MLETMAAAEPANQCQQEKADGTACRGRARPGSRFCTFHDPELAQQQAAARKAGGKARSKTAAVLSDAPDLPLRTIGDAVALLAATVNEVRTGKLDVKIANAVGYLLTVFIRAIEAGVVPEEIVRLRQQLEDLRREYVNGQAGPRGHPSGIGRLDGAGPVGSSLGAAARPANPGAG